MIGSPDVTGAVQCEPGNYVLPKPARSLQLGIDIDLGQNLRIRGKGIDTLVQGKLVLSGTSIAQPRLVGSVNTVRGTYRAYGQQLDVERGVLRFTGALDNPTLDVLAIRPEKRRYIGCYYLSGKPQ